MIKEQKIGIKINSLRKQEVITSSSSSNNDDNNDNNNANKVKKTPWEKKKLEVIHCLKGNNQVGNGRK